MIFEDPDPALELAGYPTISPIDPSGFADVRVAVNAEGNLLDTSGNAYHLAASSGPVYVTIDGKRGVWLRSGSSLYQATSFGDYPPLRLLGAMTEHLLIHPTAAIGPGGRAQLGGFFGSGETEDRNALWGFDLESTGQIAPFWEYGGGSDVRPIQQFGLKVGRWMLLSLVRTSGTAYRVFIDGEKLMDNTVAQAATGGTFARLEVAGFLGIWGGMVVTGAAQSDADVLEVARQVGTAKAA